MQSYILLILGVVCAAAGGEMFVRGAVGMAQAARISGAIIGATVAAFATSSPELAVAIGSATAQRPQIALGDALGSNVVNIALILGLVVAISPIHSPRATIVRDFPVALAVPIAIGIFSLDGTLSLLDGTLLMCLFAVWLVAVVRDAMRQREIAATATAGPTWRTVIYAAAGLALLFLAGQFIVGGARGIAASFGISEFVIGATVVAIGTSIPELATAVVAKLRGHDEVGLGTLLGSNIFNCLWIVPVAAVIHPIEIEWPKLTAALAFGILAMVIVFPPRDGVIGRVRGVALLLSYVAYVAAVLLT